MMTYAEDAERELVQLMFQNRHGAFSRIEKSKCIEASKNLN